MKINKDQDGLQENSRKPKAIYWHAARILLWGAIIWFFLQFMDRWPTQSEWLVLIDYNSVPAMIALGVMFILATALRVLRWIVLLRGAHQVSFAKAMPVFGWSFLLMTITPLRAGELLRPAWIRKQGGAFSMAVGVLVVERLADLTVLAGFLIIGFGSHVLPLTSRSYIIEPLDAVLLAAVYFVATLLSPHIKKWLELREMDRGAGKWAVSTLDGLAQASNPITSLKVLGLTVMLWSVLAIGYGVVLQSFFPGIHWTSAIMVIAAVNLAGLVWLSPGNVGIYEAVIVMVLGIYAIAPQDALIAAIGLHASILLSTAIVGVISKILLIKDGNKLGDLV